MKNSLVVAPGQGVIGYIKLNHERSDESRG